MTGIVRPAPMRLADLVCEMRSDWARAEVDGAIGAAGIAAQDPGSGWSWARTATELLRLACDLEASPRALADACRDPRDRHSVPVAPGAVAEYAEARQRIDAAHAEPQEGAA